MRILIGIIVGLGLLALSVPFAIVIFGLIVIAGIAVMFGKGTNLEVEKTRCVDETDDDGIVWSTTKTTTRRVWVDGELIVDETRTVEE